VGFLSSLLGINQSEIFSTKIARSNKNNLNGFLVMIKGEPKIGFSRNIDLYIKLRDKESQLPIISNIHNYSEANSTVFEGVTNIGNFKVGNYWPDWGSVGGFIDEMIVGPYKGRRVLECFVFVCDANDPPNFKFNNVTNERSIIDMATCEYNYNFINTGYREIDKNRLRTQEIAIELAIGISLSDGSLDDDEGFTIRDWIAEIINNSNDEHQNEIKNLLNKALERGFDNYNSKKFNIDLLCKEVKEIASISEKYNLLELCLDVMAADGSAESNEMKYINQISNKIGIDYNEMTKLKDRRLVDIKIASNSEDNATSNNNSLEITLGIDPEWSSEKKKSFVNKEFSKWNSRVSILPEGKEKINATQKLQLLAEVKKNLDSFKS